MSPKKAGKRCNLERQLEFGWSTRQVTGNTPLAQSRDTPLQSSLPSPDHPETPTATGHGTAGATIDPSVPSAAYAPGHPWHYYPPGDNAPPIPFESIPASESAGRLLADELPKSPVKRILAIRTLLESEQAELVNAHARYQAVVESGAEALSQYDREIAYGGNDELARAGALAILYNQISWRRGRIACLEREQTRGRRTR